MMMQNYAETLEEENGELRSKVQAAIADKQTAERSSAKNKKLAKDRLEKWHAERHLRSVAQDHAAQQKKIATQMQQTTEKYEAFINKSEDMQDDCSRPIALNSTCLNLHAVLLSSWQDT